MKQPCAVFGPKDHLDSFSKAKTITMCYFFPLILVVGLNIQGNSHTSYVRIHLRGGFVPLI